MKSDKKALIISKATPAELSNQQKTFNKLTAQIESLQKEIVSEEANLNAALLMYHETIKPLLTERANLMFEFAMSIDSASNRFKQIAKRKKLIEMVIIGLCERAFMDIIPNAEQEAFYNAWARISYKEETTRQENVGKKMIADQMKMMFDIELDVEKMGNNEEELMKYLFGFREELLEKSNQNSGAKPNRKKTKKQIEREAMQKAEAELKDKSVRSVYISLAKLLHPDTASNELERAEKEETMKKVTAAYDNKDLVALLMLETEWVHNQSDHISQLSEDKLKIYINVLKEQVRELQAQKESLMYHPRYSEMGNFVYDLTEKKHANRLKKILRTNIESYKIQIKNLSSEALSAKDFDLKLHIYAEEFNYEDDDDLVNSILKDLMRR